MAFMILSVISLVLTALIPATITGMHKAAMRSNAGLLANNTMAQLKQTGFGKLAPTTTPEIVTIAGTEYQLEIALDPAPLSTGGGTMETDVAKLVSVMVTWNDRNGEQKHVTRAVVFKRI